MSGAPVHLLEGGNLSKHQRAVLESAQARASVEYDVDKGAARFREALAAPHRWRRGYCNRAWHADGKHYECRPKQSHARQVRVQPALLSTRRCCRRRRRPHYKNSVRETSQPSGNVAGADRGGRGPGRKRASLAVRRNVVTGFTPRCDIRSIAHRILHRSDLRTLVRCEHTRNRTSVVLLGQDVRSNQMRRRLT